MILVSFDDYQLIDGIPIYLQIIGHIKRGIVSGVVVNGDLLPSRRMLAAKLSINPNTVQKACRILEDEGLITSHTGAASLMVIDENSRARVRHELLKSDAEMLIFGMKEMGISKEETLAVIEKYWD